MTAIEIFFLSIKKSGEMNKEKKIIIDRVIFIICLRCTLNGSEGCMDTVGSSFVAVETTD